MQYTCAVVYTIAYFKVGLRNNVRTYIKNKRTARGEQKQQLLYGEIESEFRVN